MDKREFNKLMFVGGIPVLLSSVFGFETGILYLGMMILLSLIELGENK